MWNVVLDLDHAVRTTEHRVQALREADEAGQGRYLLELLHRRGERCSVRRAMRPVDRRDDAVDGGRPGDEASGPRLDLLGELVHGRVRIAAERVGERDEEVVRHLRALWQPVHAVTRPRVENRRVVAERPEAGD